VREPMEFMLLLWDELDDWTGACRHLAGEVVSEIGAVAAPLTTALLAGTVAAWVLVSHLHPLTGI
jgi:hypothetical protein